MQATPALPWAAGSGGTIQLSEPVSYNDIAAGKIVIVATPTAAGSNPITLEPVEGSSYVFFKDGQSQVLVVDKFEGDSATIELLTSTESNNYSITSISVATPMPVEGDVQIFADKFCSQYPSGEVSKVYVRINNPWVGADSGWDIRDAATGKNFQAFAPETATPDDPYGLIVWLDFSSPDSEDPYEVGQVVEAVASSPAVVTDYQFIFSRAQ